MEPDTTSRSSKPWPPLWSVVGGTLLVGLVVLLVYRASSEDIERQGGTVVQGEQAVQTATVNIPVEGMSCSSCAASVKRAAESVPGVKDARVDLIERVARVEYVGSDTTPEQIAAAISERGFKASVPTATGGQ